MAHDRLGARDCDAQPRPALPVAWPGQLDRVHAAYAASMCRGGRARHRGSASHRGPPMAPGNHKLNYLYGTTNLTACPGRRCASWADIVEPDCVWMCHIATTRGGRTHRVIWRGTRRTHYTAGLASA